MTNTTSRIEIRYFIANVDETHMVWHNDQGWIDSAENDVPLFTAEEKESLNLPMGGMWIMMPTLKR